MPEPTLAIDYNRYLYARANPLNLVDPSGHCPSHWGSTEPEVLGCWQIATSIENMFEESEYWQNRFTSKEVWQFIAAVPDNDLEWMQQELQWYFESDEYQALRLNMRQNSRKPPGPDAFSEAWRAYCGEHDCFGMMLDGIGVAMGATAFATCIPGFAVCGAVLFVTSGVSTVVGGVGVARTAARALEGDATTVDVLATTTTYILGFGGHKPVWKAVFGTAGSALQFYWDHEQLYADYNTYE